MAYSPGLTRSTKGASKHRRDLINLEIDNLKDLLPLPESVRQRLFQLQVMSLVCIFIRKERYLPHILGESANGQTSHMIIRQQHQRLPKFIDSCKSLRGFLLMVTRQGKLLYLSDNASDYLGHSVEEIMSQGDSLYDLVDSRDHGTVQTELLSGPPSITMHMRFPDERVFICRMNLSRAAKRQLQYQKFILVHGRYLHPAEYYQALLTLTAPGLFIHPVFAAFCQPLITPENAESLAAGNTTIFCSLHHMDMTVIHLDEIAIFHLGYKRKEIVGKSWYRLIHPHDLPEVSFKHKLRFVLSILVSEDKESACILLVRLQAWSGKWLWLHTVLAIREGMAQRENDVEQLILATYQMLRYSDTALNVLTTRASEIIAEAIAAGNSQLPQPVPLEMPITALLDVSDPQQGFKYKRKNGRSASAGRQLQYQTSSETPYNNVPRRYLRHSCTEETCFTFDQPPSQYQGDHRAVGIKNSRAAAASDADQTVPYSALDQIRVEIPSHSAAHHSLSTPQLGARGAAQLGNIALPSLLTPESSPADSSSSSGGSGRMGSTSNYSYRLTTNGASSATHKPNAVVQAPAKPAPTESGRPAEPLLPEIEPHSLEAYLRHVESEPILGDGTSSAASTSANRSTPTQQTNKSSGNGRSALTRLSSCAKDSSGMSGPFSHSNGDRPEQLDAGNAPYTGEAPLLEALLARPARLGPYQEQTEAQMHGFEGNTFPSNRCRRFSSWSAGGV